MPFCLGTDDIGSLKPCNIKRLRWRIEDDTILTACFADSSLCLELIARHNEFAVDLVAYHLYTVFHADIVHALEFSLGPHTTTGVMRIAK